MNTGRTRVVIVGSGRSGSGYINTLLNESKVSCGHEQLFELQVRPRLSKSVESSWLALPRIERYGFGGTVYHQIRNPIDVMNSLMNGRLFRDRYFPYLWFRSEHFYETMPPADADWTGWMMRHLVDWLRRCDTIADKTYRLEDVNASLVVEIGTAAGVAISPKVAEQAVNKVSKTTNKHEDGPQLDWEQLSKYDGYHDLRSIAGHYGYV